MMIGGLPWTRTCCANRSEMVQCPPSEEVVAHIAGEANDGRAET